MRYLCIAALVIVTSVGAAAPAAGQETPRRTTVDIGRVAVEAMESGMLQRARARRAAPYRTASWVLMGGGGMLTVLGMLGRPLLHYRVCVSAEVMTDGVSLDVGCGIAWDSTLVGLGAVGVGAWLYMKGNAQRDSMPSLSLAASGNGAAVRWSF